MYLFFAANPKKPATFDARKRLMDAAAGYGFLCVELEERAPEPGEDGVVIAIGGDGSIIRQVPVAMTAHMPILGVHFGRVGFLTELTEEGFIAALPRLKAGDYRLEQRNMLDCQVSTGRVYRCLNDAVLYKLSFSPITGPKGNIEFLLFLRNGDVENSVEPTDFEETVARIVEDSHKFHINC